MGHSVALGNMRAVILNHLYFRGYLPGGYLESSWCSSDDLKKQKLCFDFERIAQMLALTMPGSLIHLYIINSDN